VVAGSISQTTSKVARAIVECYRTPSGVVLAMPNPVSSRRQGSEADGDARPNPEPW
jgi:hypothetical protein